MLLTPNPGGKKKPLSFLRKAPFQYVVQPCQISVYHQSNRSST